MKKEELELKLTEAKQDLGSLRVAKVTGATNSKVCKIRVVKRNIARLLTIMTEMQRENLIKFYRGKKHIPKDLRLKRTRAQRRAMTVFERTRKTRKQLRKACTFPVRKYAVKA